MKNIILIITVIATGIMLIAGFYSWIFAWFYCKPKKYKAKKTPENYGIPAEPIQILSQGKKLEGWLARHTTQNQPARLIIMVHGWSTNFSMLLPLAKMLFEEGNDIFLYDARGHGNSDQAGPITLKKMAEDITSVVDFVYMRYLSGDLQLVLLGHSMGASAAIVAASDDLRIDKIIACSPVAHPKTLTLRHAKQMKIPLGILRYLVFYFIERWLGTSMDEIAPITRISHIDKDILLIHGLQDKYIPYSDSVSLKNVCTSDKIEFLGIEKRDHYDILRDQTFKNKVLVFVTEDYGQSKRSIEKEKIPEDSLYRM